MTTVLRGQGADEYEFFSASRGLVGWIRKDLPENLFDEFIRDPDGLMDRGSSGIVKDGPKTKVVRHIFQDGKGVKFNVITKQFYYGAGFRRLGFLFFPSPAARCLNGALLLKSKAILTPRPLAAFEFRSWRRLGTSYYITEEVKDSRSLRDLWRIALPALARSERHKVSGSILHDLARLLSRLHALGIYHRDLKGTNILFREWERPQRQIFLVDLDRVEETTRLSLSRRLKNLAQIRRGAWSMRERIYFFMRYAELYGSSKKEAKALTRRLLAQTQRRA